MVPEKNDLSSHQEAPITFKKSFVPVKIEQKDRKLAKDILEEIKKLDHPFELDTITPGNGDCFLWSILQQCQRPEIFEGLTANVKAIVNKNDPTLLRRAVHDFIQKTEHSKIKELKEFYEACIPSKSSQTWASYWKEMTTPRVWASHHFIQAMAWFLRTNLVFFSTTDTEEHPITLVEANMDDTDFITNGPLLIASKTDCHFQSLLPITKSNSSVAEKEETESDRATAGLFEESLVRPNK